MSAQPPPPPINPLQYATPTQGVVCPQCGQAAAEKVNFSWWGGVLGPRLFNHHKCKACKFTFNAKTGKSNNTAIIIYTLVSLLIVGAILLFSVLNK